MDPQDAAGLTLSVYNWYLDEDKFSTKTYHVPLSDFTYTNQIWKNMQGHFTALNAPSLEPHQGGRTVRADRCVQAHRPARLLTTQTTVADVSSSQRRLGRMRDCSS
ncbi:hypothetical protein GCM10009543_17410 [Leifsonia naganoensis]